MRYDRKNGDVGYRLVSLSTNRIPDWCPFHNDWIEYPKDTVLEINRTDGTTVLEYAAPAERILVDVRGNGILAFLDRVPTAHLWLRRIDNRGNRGDEDGEVLYKVPDNLPKKNDVQLMLLTANYADYEFFGDQYFNKAYEFVR